MVAKERFMLFQKRKPFYSIQWSVNSLSVERYERDLNKCTCCTWDAFLYSNAGEWDYKDVH
jgi:hypothetical protein